MTRMALALVWMSLLLAGCASSQDARLAARDAPAHPYPWCAAELRAAASQPMPADAGSEQKRIMRDYHVSKACQRAAPAEEVRIDIGGRVPPPRRPH